ncbi:MAG TPA: HD domain-containing phosphohydrolase, partial [Thermoleophilaceae bacterium]|nr:HD domain-containing phosphohydrolase [Thermoleophilaceae bacterium]
MSELRHPLFLAAVALFAAAALFLLGTVVSGGNLADSTDDLLPLLFGLAALLALAGWLRDRRASAAQAQAAERRAQEAQRRAEEAQQRAEEAERHAAETERLAAEAGRQAEATQREAAEEREKLEDKLKAQRKEIRQEQLQRVRVERARKAEKEWARELRDQIMHLHTQRGVLGYTGDVRELVLQVAITQTQSEKGVLLAREDLDKDGNLDLVCYRGFEQDPGRSDLAQRFADKVIERDEIVREDNPGSGASPADEEIKNLVAIPIYIADDFEGVVVCANREGGYEELDDDVLLALGNHAGAAMENGHVHGRLRKSYVATVRMLADAIEAKDPFVRSKSDRVSRYVAAVAERLGFDQGQRERLVFAALLHDVGKIGISERILLKPGPLTDQERTLCELHPRIGSRIIENVPGLSEMMPAVLHHHERYDGSGYPSGLKGEEIPLEARIVCVADSFSAMTSKRPYRDGMSAAWACEELKRCAGSQFDPKVVALFVDEVQSRPPSDQPMGSLAQAFDDPEVRTRRHGNEAVLGYGPTTMTDNLTLLFSFSHLHELAQAECERAQLQGVAFAVVMVELTDIHLINSRDGHAAGDVAIQTVARALERAAARCGGSACRYSGARLALLMPRAGERAAVEAATDLCAELDA